MAASPNQIEFFELRTGNALQLLREIPDESVQTCTTSPPYNNGGGLHGAGRWTPV
jgi:DNA modification methylase